MKTLNLPVEMISICSVDGQLRPLRFRFEDESHRIFTIKIAEILVSRELNYAGCQNYQYTCRAELDDKARLFDLRYAVKAHKWTLFRTMD